MKSTLVNKTKNSTCLDLREKKLNNYLFLLKLTEEKHLIIDCHINCEDVTLGLALQYFTPFRFFSRKIWCSYGFLESEYSFKNYDLLTLINPAVNMQFYFNFFEPINYSLILKIVFDTPVLERPVYD